tara:strand:+ start:1596 stop:2042 length:447 start_codon:yes stop_codon:yes gene_type:complete
LLTPKALALLGRNKEKNYAVVVRIETFWQKRAWAAPSKVLKTNTLFKAFCSNSERTHYIYLDISCIEYQCRSHHSYIYCPGLLPGMAETLPPCLQAEFWCRLALLFRAYRMEPENGPLILGNTGITTLQYIIKSKDTDNLPQATYLRN